MITSALERADIVVLDAHGVVFNRVLPTFLRAHGVERGEDPDTVWQRWRQRYRLDLWEGRTTPNEMWSGMFPGDDPDLLSTRAERLYERGPMFGFVEATSARLWLLSNHHSCWLQPRLERFGIADRFERVLVSDRLGVAKPDPAAFAAVVDAMDHDTVCLLDDSPANVAVAGGIGIDAHLVGGDPLGDQVRGPTVTEAAR